VKPSSRWLIIFGAAIGALVIVAIALVFTLGGPRSTPPLPENTPEGTVQRYFLALQAEDYVTAYSYLSPPPSAKLTYDDWVRSIYTPAEKSEWKVTLGKSAVTGSEATVNVVIDVFRAGEPLDNPVHTHHVTFFLKQEGTSWKITSPWDVWWLFY
jgi:hypothetical protein